MRIDWLLGAFKCLFGFELLLSPQMCRRFLFPGRPVRIKALKRVSDLESKRISPPSSADVLRQVHPPPLCPLINRLPSPPSSAPTYRCDQ